MQQVNILFLIYLGTILFQQAYTYYLCEKENNPEMNLETLQVALQFLPGWLTWLNWLKNAVTTATWQWLRMGL